MDRDDVAASGHGVYRRSLAAGKQTTRESPIVPRSSTAGFLHSSAYLPLMGSISCAAALERAAPRSRAFALHMREVTPCWDLASP
jgi:hypothetical protein